MADKLQPYVGPRPFEREDQSSFFGRDREARDLLSYVIAHEVVLLYAQSGAGKTSLLNAKLIPLLEEKGFEVLPTARVRGSIPEGVEADQIPNLYVFNTLIDWAGGESKPEDLARMSLAQFLSAQEQRTDEEGMASTRRVIIFDQFEELFSFYPERWAEREDFFRQVAEILTDPALRVLFAMREDYLANLAPYERLLPERLRTRYRLERLSAEAALQAVEGPLQDTGYSFADGVAASLVQELLNIKVRSAADEMVEVPGEYAEPVQLQVVCQNLWMNLPSDVQIITAEHLQSFGNVEEALRSFYERAIETAATEASVSKDDLRKWFNEQLITPAGTRGTVFRGDEQTGDIPNSAVDILEDQHIIRAEVRSGARWYELTHDRLIEPIRKANEAWQEKEQERRIEEERQRVRAEEQAKTIRRFRILTAAMVMLLLAAIAASVFAFRQRQDAKEEARIAEEQRQEAEEALKLVAQGNQKKVEGLRRQIQEKIADAEQGERLLVYVSADGSDSKDGSSNNPFKTIQKGIDMAPDDGTVLVMDGTYTGPGNVNLDFEGKAITVKSESGKPEACIIDCQKAEVTRGFNFVNSEGADSRLEGFAIRNGNPLGTPSGGGGGILCNNSSSPTITNCTIAENTAGWFGGGILCSSSSSPTITNCTITKNSAHEAGGGIACWENSSPTIINCTIAGNTIKEDSIQGGGGIACYHKSSPTIVNCTVTRNAGGRYRIGGIFCYGGSFPAIVNTILWNNDIREIRLSESSSIAVSYCDVKRGWRGEGNIDSDPLFVNAANGNYRLRQGSPCIDRGTLNGAPEKDIEGNPRQVRPDIGAYESKK